MDSNFFNYISKQLDDDDVEIWFKMNNIIPEKMELYNDFCTSLYEKIEDTYLGSGEANETKISLSPDDKLNHFNWCWNQVISDFEKENIKFNLSGEHYEYLFSFFVEAYYNQNNIEIKKSIKIFLHDLFSLDGKYTKSDLDMLGTVYKYLEKNMLII